MSSWNVTSTVKPLQLIDDAVHDLNMLKLGMSRMAAPWETGLVQWFKLFFILFLQARIGEGLNFLSVGHKDLIIGQSAVGKFTAVCSLSVAVLLGIPCFSDAADASAVTTFATAAPDQGPAANVRSLSMPGLSYPRLGGYGNGNTESRLSPYGASKLTDKVLSKSKSRNKPQSKGWEAARQKRTAAVKVLQEKGIVTVDTDDSGNQFISLPWIPNQKVAYKSLTLKQRLVNEVCAGAFGEISKDLLLHAVDTMKIRRQAAKSATVVGLQPSLGEGGDSGYREEGLHQSANDSQQLSLAASSSITASHHSVDHAAMGMPATLAPARTLAEIDIYKPNLTPDALGSIGAIVEKLKGVKGLYAGFPIVALTSIPQGGLFFLVKKSLIEFLTINAPHIPEAIAGTVPIVAGVMVYWLLRTPAEVIKTQVQTGQLPSVRAAIEEARLGPKNFAGLWSAYPVMLSVDIPFQLINFVLYGSLSDAVANAGVPSNVLSRLFCGITCGMVSAAVTCPVDVGKTRIISKQKAAQKLAVAISSAEDAMHYTDSPISVALVDTPAAASISITTSTPVAAHADAGSSARPSAERSRAAEAIYSNAIAGITIDTTAYGPAAMYGVASNSTAAGDTAEEVNSVAERILTAASAAAVQAASLFTAAEHLSTAQASLSEDDIAGLDLPTPRSEGTVEGTAPQSRPGFLSDIPSKNTLFNVVTESTGQSSTITLQPYYATHQNTSSSREIEEVALFITNAAATAAAAEAAMLMNSATRPHLSPTAAASGNRGDGGNISEDYYEGLDRVAARYSGADSPSSSRDLGMDLGSIWVRASALQGGQPALTELRVERGQIMKSAVPSFSSTKSNSGSERDSSTGKVAAAGTAGDNVLVVNTSSMEEESVDTSQVSVTTNTNIATELVTIFKNEGIGALFLGFNQRLLYTGLANGIRLSAYGTSRMDLMMRSLDDL